MSKRRLFDHFNSVDVALACNLCGAVGLSVGWSGNDLLFYCPICDYNQHIYGWEEKVIRRIPLNWEPVYADHIVEGHVG